MTTESYQELWYQAITPTFWCERYAHSFHRVCPVILNYENLPEPFKNVAGEMEHEGKTGDRVHISPETCYNCARNIINGGTCDPL